MPVRLWLRIFSEEILNQAVRGQTLDERNMLRLTLTELENAVRAADPAAFLVLPRILRRVVKQDRRLSGFGLKVPHRKS